MLSSQTASSTTSTSLKRARPSTHEQPPRITGELILQVYTHKSLRRPADKGDSVNYNNDFEDNERLSHLGEKALETAVTFALFSRRPMLKTAEIQTHRKEVLSHENYERWVTMYGMRERLRCHPDVFASLSSPEETKSLFTAYVGGVYAENGIGVVQDWVNHLLSLDSSPPEPPGQPPPPPASTPPPSKKLKSESGQSPMHITPYNEYQNIFFGSQPPASPVVANILRQAPPHQSTYPSPPSSYVPPPPSSSYPQPPPPPSSSYPHPPPPPSPYSYPPPPSHSHPASLPNPLAPAQPGLAFLPLFNQTATQRRVTVEYPAEFSGPSHAGRWTVKCVVNGILKGIGTGGSKQVAKEEAARQAYYAMGWT